MSYCAMGGLIFPLYIHACLLNDMMSQVVDLLNTIRGTRMTTTRILLSSCYPTAHLYLVVKMLYRS